MEENKTQQNAEQEVEKQEEIAAEEQNQEQPEEKTETPEEEEVDELSKLQAELSESKDKYLRLYSEFDNYRRRTSKERLELIKTAGEDIITSLLPVIDDFERAQKSLDEKADVKAVLEGIDLIYNKFYKALEAKGVKSIDIKQGADFDPEIQEAITQIPAPSEKLKGKVVDVIEKGYYLEEKVIRFAKVVTGA